jgi:hypothetical protein
VEERGISETQLLKSGAKAMLVCHLCYRGIYPQLNYPSERVNRAFILQVFSTFLATQSSQSKTHLADKWIFHIENSSTQSGTLYEAMLEQATNTCV